MAVISQQLALDGLYKIYQQSMSDNNPSQYSNTLNYGSNNYQYNDYQPTTYHPFQNSDSRQQYSTHQSGKEQFYTISKQPTYYSSNVAPQQGLGGSRARTETNNLVGSRVTNQQVVKGQSRINYVPYEKKVTQYEDRQYVERVPVKKKKTRLEERRVVETVPHEVVKTEYYSVEHRVQYHKEIIPEKKIEMVPVEKKVKRYEYIPVEKQIIHYPENVDFETAKGQSRAVLGQQGISIKSDAEYRRLDPQLIYSYSNRPENRYNPIGYVDQGHSRVLSTAPTYVNQPYYPPAPEYVYDNTQVSSGYQPFRNMETSNTETYIAPQMTVTDPYGGVREQAVQRGSYINDGNYQQGGINETSTYRSGGKSGITTTVKRSSKMSNYDDYSQGPGRQNSHYERYNDNTSDWRIQN